MSALRIAAGLLVLAVASTVHALVLLALMPWRGLRIRSCNVWGWVVGRTLLALGGVQVTVDGRALLRADRPAIYVSNHTSIHDIFLGIWLGPLGAVGVAKKEIVYYPFFGQLYWLSGHLLLDRGNHERAVAAMRTLVRHVKRYGLSIWMWPEGTRSRDGRLQPFKKGLWHLAVETGLPVVPVVVSGAHRTWAKGSLRLRPAEVRVTVGPEIDTSGWKDRAIDSCLEEVRAVFVAGLPGDQLPGG
jgi:lysophosphatidate acyltransferase